MDSGNLHNIGSDMPPEVGQNMQFLFSPVAAPDGTIYVSVSVLLGICQFSFAVPVDAGKGWVDNFRTEFTRALVDAKRLRSGLVLPTVPSVADLSMGNQRG